MRKFGCRLETQLDHGPGAIRLLTIVRSTWMEPDNERTVQGVDGNLGQYSRSSGPCLYKDRVQSGGGVRSSLTSCGKSPVRTYVDQRCVCSKAEINLRLRHKHKNDAENEYRDCGTHGARIYDNGFPPKAQSAPDDWPDSSCGVW